MSSSTKKHSFPLKSLNMKDFFLPQLGKKKMVHSKNPFKVKPMFFPDEAKRPQKKLDGNLILFLTKAELPHEVVKADLSNQNIVELVATDLKYFVNLEYLDLSENMVDLSQFIFLPNLLVLKLQSSLITDLNFPKEIIFPKLQELNLSFNRINTNQLSSLLPFTSLHSLSLSGNDLREVIEDWSSLKNLEELDLSLNSFSSEHKATNFWSSLATLPKLKNLNISRNFLRGIHTEKLVSGNFADLESLDFSFNIVENQHNLICARNFKNLKKLIVTGNPFAVQKQHQGLQMEIYARTGGEVINSDIVKSYLKGRVKPKEEKGIYYPNMVVLQEKILKKNDKTYFFGVELPNYSKSFKDLRPKIETEKEELGDTIEEEEDGAKFFLTEDVNNNTGKKKKGQTAIEENEDNVLNPIENESNLKNGNYQEFRQMANEIIGSEVEYGNPINLTSAYKILNDVLKKPANAEFQDFMEPNYMKRTAVIQKIKFNDELKELEKLSAGYVKAIQPKGKQTELKTVEKILDDLNKKMKKI